jgi:hypothetical protein
MTISKLFKSANSDLAGFSHLQLLSNNQMLYDVKYIGNATILSLINCNNRGTFSAKITTCFLRKRLKMQAFTEPYEFAKTIVNY